MFSGATARFRTFAFRAKRVWTPAPVPMTPWNFARIPGLEEEKRLLKRLARQDRIPHAQMFLGDYGSGNLALALAFARLVLCREADVEEPCERCSACIKSAEWKHPDLHFSFPVVGAKLTSREFLEPWRQLLAEGLYFDPAGWFEVQDKSGKQGNINVAETREIVGKLGVTAAEGGYKILLLWGVEYLEKEGNRLLKLIEEPPDRTLFLIIGADSSRILPTILSRCQLTKVRPFTDMEIEEALLAQGLAGTRDAAIIAFQADGNLGDALRLVRQGGQPLADLFLRWMRSCWPPPGKESLKRTEELAALGKEEQKSFFRYALHFVRQMVMARVGHPEAIRLPEEERKIAAGMAAQFDDDRLEALGRFFSDCHYAIERNANAKILFLNASIQVHALFRDKVRYLSTINQS